MTRQVFKQSLLVSAIREANRLNYRLSLSVKNKLIKLINSGVERMSSSEFQSKSGRHEAELNLIRLIEHMVLNAESRNISKSLDSRAFSSVHLSICPLWPFC